MVVEYIKVWFNNNPIDIKSLVSYPFTITETLDDTLDSAQITIPYVFKSTFLFSGIDFSKPFKRYSKVEISVDGKVYRFVLSDDTVEEVVKGSIGIPNPAYSHTINLIEPTKLLQRKILPDMTVTQPAGSGDIKIVTSGKVSSTTECGNTFTNIPFTQTSPSTDTALLEFMNLKQSGRTYSINAEVTVRNEQPIEVIMVDQYLDFQLNFRLNGVAAFTSNTVRVPNPQFPGQAVERKLSVSFEVTTTSANQALTIFGRTQGFYKPGGFQDIAKVSVGNLSIVTIKETASSKIYLDQVVDKMLSLIKIKASGDLSFVPEFELGNSTRSVLGTILSPELTFSKMTLWDALRQISGYVKAIPRLGKNDFKIIEFDFIDNLGSQTFTISDYNDSSEVGFIEDYVSGLEINVTNALEDDSERFKKIEPHNLGWMTVRAPSDEIDIITEDNASLRLNQRVQKIFKVIVRGIKVRLTRPGFTDIITTDTTDWDITPYVLEENRFRVLPNTYKNSKVDRLGDVIGQGNTLYYTQGNNLIRNLGYRPPKPPGFTAIQERALYEIIYGFAQRIYGSDYTVDNNYNNNEELFENVLFRVEYAPITDIRLTVYRDDLKDFEVQSTKYVNEMANVIDLTNIGEYAKTSVNRMGNEDHKLSGLSPSVFQIPDLGSRNTQTDEIVTAKTLEFNPTLINYTIDSVKNLAGLSEFVGVNSTYRQYQIPQDNIVLRQDKYSEKFVLTKNPTTANSVYTQSGLTTLFQYWNSGSILGLDQPSYGRLTLNSTSGTILIDVPINVVSSGTTLGLSFKLKDNYSAGLGAFFETTGVEKILIQQDRQYTDALSRFTSIGVNIYDYGSIYANNTAGIQASYIDANAYPLYQDAPPNAPYSSIVIDTLKDARERYGLTQEIAFQTDTDTIRVYSGIAKYNGFTTKISGTYPFKLVALQEGYFPSPNSTVVDTSKIVDFVSVNWNTSTSSSKIVTTAVNVTFPPGNYNGYAAIDNNTKELLFAVKIFVITGINFLYNDTFYVVPQKL